MEENEMVTEELDDVMVDIELDTEGEPEIPVVNTPKDNTGNYQRAMQDERKKRQKLQDEVELLRTVIRQRADEPVKETKVDPFEAAIAKLSNDEDNADVVEALKTLYAQAAKPSDDIMDLQMDKLSEAFPGAIEHRNDIVKAAKKYGIPVKKAYFMLYGEEAVSTPKDDILRTAELAAAAKRDSVAQVTSDGNVQPTPEKRKDTIKLPASFVPKLQAAGFTTTQFANMQRLAVKYPNGIPADEMARAFGAKGETKKG